MKSKYEAVIPLAAKTVRASVLHDLPGDECWPWAGFVNKDGYGYAYEPGTLRRMRAHRLVWSLLVGELNEGEVLDHMCHDPEECDLATKCPHRACVNPSHLRITSLVDNTMRGGSPVSVNKRKTHCKHGHPFDEVNTIHRKGGGRACRACMIERFRAATIAKGGKPRVSRRRVSDEELRKS